MQAFKDKVVLITGASSGIGRATALRLAEQGANLCLAARNPQALDEVVKEGEALGARVLAVPTDVSDAEQCRRAVEVGVETFGRLDVLLCCAGLSLRSYFAECRLEVLEHVMRVNFFGTLYATHFALPHIKKSGGSLVALSSLTGRRGVPSYSIYGASKFAIEGLYESLRLELRRDGVHVGIVAPGFVDTPLRTKVLGPDGKPWPEPPPPPFRIWPLEKCVTRIVRLIVKRRAQALIPWYIGPLLALDRVVGSWIGNTILAWKFPPESKPAGESSSPRG
jgi:NAD(P)-dependent dehydrogenase (short-subunit alcohol dehydrogenase family)